MSFVSKLKGIAQSVKKAKDRASARFQMARQAYGAQAGSSMVSKIVGISVALLVTAVVFPIAIDELVSVDTSSWPSAVGTLMTVLLPVLAVIGVVLLIVDVDSLST